MKVLMRCGHTANARDEQGRPVCVICIGVRPEAIEPVPEDELPDLSGRKARCIYCRDKTDSRLDLPFFEYQPDEDEDKYYCGCRGWD